MLNLLDVHPIRTLAFVVVGFGLVVTCHTLVNRVALWVNTSMQVVRYHTPGYIVKPRVHTRFGLVTNHILFHHLPSGVEGTGKNYR